MPSRFDERQKKSCNEITSVIKDQISKMSCFMLHYTPTGRFSGSEEKVHHCNSIATGRKKVKKGECIPLVEMKVVDLQKR